MGRFHDQLVEARRNGTAPGQAGALESAPLPTAPTYSPIPEGVPASSCDRCGAVVMVDRQPQHTAWHVMLRD